MSKILTELYDNFDVEAEGDDYALHYNAPETYEIKAHYAAAMNDARNANGTLSYDGILVADTYAALAESDPALKADALLVVAATAIGFAASAQRQAEGFADKAKAPAPAKGSVEVHTKGGE